MTRKILSALVVAGVFVSAFGVRDSSGQAVKPAENKPVIFGVELRGDFTDNRDDTTTDKESTFDLFIQPSLDAILDWPTAVLTLTYAPSYRFRSNPADTQNETALFHHLVADLKWSPSNIARVGIKDTFDVIDDPSIQKNGETVRDDTSYVMNTTEAMANYRVSRLTEFHVDGQYSTKSYKEKEYADTSNESDVGGSLAILRQVQRTLAVVAVVKYTQYSYEKTLGFDRGFSVMAGGLGIENMVGKELLAGVKGGYSAASYNDSELGDMNSPFVDAYLKYTPGSKIRVVGDVQHAISASTVYPYASQKATVLNLSTEWDADVKFTVGAVVYYAMGKYEVDTVSEELIDSGDYTNLKDGNQDVIGASAKVIYKFDKDTSVKLAQSFEKLDSDVRDGYDKNTTSLSLIMKF